MPKSTSPIQWVRPLVRQLHPYVPGEQPKIRNLIKLNTNENPYPPAPKVLKAVRQAVDDRLRLYPNPTSQPLRERIAQLHQCAPAQVLIGNGSDEVLALAIKAFVEPLTPHQSTPKSRNRVQYFDPSYSLYPVLADIHGAVRHPVPLGPGFELPTTTDLRRGRTWDFKAALTIVTTPNAPSGRGYSKAALERLVKAQKGLVLLDEAYVDFAPEHAADLALKHPHVLVARTFSKAYSLCFQRVGYILGHPVLIDALDRIRDSYNVNGLGQVAALETLNQLPYYRRQFQRICSTRDEVSRALTHLGFRVLPSATNFILAHPPAAPAQQWLQWLRDNAILVRWFKQPGINQYLRITIGSEKEMQTFLKCVRTILSRCIKEARRNTGRST